MVLQKAMLQKLSVINVTGFHYAAALCLSSYRCMRLQEIVKYMQVKLIKLFIKNFPSRFKILNKNDKNSSNLPFFIISYRALMLQFLFSHNWLQCKSNGAPERRWN